MAKKNVAVGFDLGEYSVKCAALDTHESSIYGLWEAEVFPERQSQDESVPFEILKDRLQKFIGECKKDAPEFNRQVRTSVPGEFFGYLELPVLSEKELKVAVPFEAQKHIPFSLDEVTLNHIAVPQLSQDKKKSAIFFVAARKESIKAHSNLLGSCGLTLDRVEVPTLALTREFAHNHSKSSNEFIALIHLGSSSSRVIIVQNGYPYYTRKIPVAGRDFTYAFQMGRQWSWPEAEKYKLSYNVSHHEVGLEPFLNRLNEEIKKSLDFFVKESIGTKAKVSKVFLSGGTALFEGLAVYLSERLGLPVSVDSWENFKPNTTSMQAASFKIAVGLALGD